MATLPDAFGARFAQTIARAEDSSEERAAAIDDASARGELSALYERHAPRVQRFLCDAPFVASSAESSDEPQAPIAQVTEPAPRGATCDSLSRGADVTCGGRRP